MKPIPPADSDAWNLAEGASAGQPTLIRYRPSLAAYLGDSRYPRRLTITWTYDTNASGMPTHEESDRMRCLEYALDSALDPDRVAILAFVFTHAGERKWHYYVADIKTVGERINRALADQPQLPIALEVEDDPDWREMRMVLRGCKDKRNSRSEPSPPPYGSPAAGSPSGEA